MRFFRRILAIGFIGLACALHGQVAPDIPRGTPPEKVIRLRGWPNGRSVNERREVWNYDSFQVVFEDGKVLSVTPTRGKDGRPAQGNPAVRRPIQARPSPPPQVRQKTGTPKPVTTAPVIMPRSVLATNPKPAPRVAPQSVAVKFFSPLKALLWAGLFVVAVALVARVAAATKQRERREQQEREALRTKAERMREPDRRPFTQVVDDALDRARRVTKVDAPRNVTRSTGDETLDTRSTEPPRRPLDLSALSLTLLRELEWKRFELLVARYFAATGLRAELTGPGADGGIDVKLYRAGSERPHSFVQCKAWGSAKVGVAKLRELNGVMAPAGVTEGIFVTTSDFHPDARAFASATNIHAVSGARFLEMFADLPEAARREILAEVTLGDYTTPSCPKCEVKAVARANKTDGTKFWACTRCRWTMTARGEE